MTDFLKLAEMQRTNVEIERQRHLTNWLIKSSPHMATPQTAVSSNSSPTTAITATAPSSGAAAVASTSGKYVANAIDQDRCSNANVGEYGSPFDSQLNNGHKYHSDIL